ncbi:sugar transferase [Aquabacter sp. CN5-332]|uniref:sugar transferase n=1 Tax=Aquabacter sp. CN5-332 TaxID=3156608 RepID=UPI0032B61617
MLLLVLLFWASVAAIIYHHALYPPLLRRLARGRRAPAMPPVPADLPPVTLIIPAYQEAAFIGAKLLDCARLAYPADCLKVIVACDGCTDGTEEAARAALALPDCAGLDAEIRAFPVNRGKVAVLNELIGGLGPGIVGLSDVSASLSPDSLMRAAAHFSDPAVGVVAATYALRSAGSTGEAGYWRYQTGIKADETALGGPIGAHGAFYLFRRDLWTPLEADTINDDVILPTRIIGAGARAVYDVEMVATEEERTVRAQEFRRRIRISSGNVQQVLRLWPLASRHRPGLAFIFLSGKALRAFVPFLMVLAFVSNLALAASGASFYQFLLAGQAGFYALAVITMLQPAGMPRVARFAAYFVEGHAAGLIGGVRQLSGQDKGRWGRAGQTKVSTRAEDDFIHPLVRTGKRAFDIVLGAGALLVLGVMFIPVALAIKLTSRGPVLYRQLRVGEADPTCTRLFYLYKFRSMYIDAEKRGAVWASANDPRVTAVGRFMRKTRIDELPQAINVLKGEMSIVGPRPERPVFFQKLETEIPFYVERTFGLKPGITGLAQVNQGYDASIEDVRSKVSYDHAYAMRLLDPVDWIKTDLWIILRTFSTMVHGRGQ